LPAEVLKKRGGLSRSSADALKRRKRPPGRQPFGVGISVPFCDFQALDLEEEDGLKDGQSLRKVEPRGKPGLAYGD